MKKYALIGTSCVGKTTLVNELNNLLKKEIPGINVEVVSEAARFYFSYNVTSEPFSYFHQGRIQTIARIQEELIYYKNPNIILTDRSVLDSIAYVKATGGNGFANKLYEKEKKWLSTYTNFFLLDPKGIPYKTDAIRKESKNTREGFHKTFLETLSDFNLPYTLISGSFDTRLKRMLSTILSEL